MDDATRKTVLTAYQQLKRRDHYRTRFLGESTAVDVAALQALLMVRWIRGDLDAYPPFIWKG